jgi:stage III sporulation protein AH
VAGYLNIRYGITPTKEVALPDEEVEEDVSAESYFASAIIDRERARGEALEVLVSITEDEEASETAKTDAFTQMERIANETSWEIDIENLVKAKGFEECVAIINDDNANIVVSSDGLTPGEVAQIKEIVYLEASIQPKSVKIIEKDSK